MDIISLWLKEDDDAGLKGRPLRGIEALSDHITTPSLRSVTGLYYDLLQLCEASSLSTRCKHLSTTSQNRPTSSPFGIRTLGPIDSHIMIRPA